MTALWPRRDRPSPLKTDLFSRSRSERERVTDPKLERLYHTGQHRIWDGRDQLAAALERHGGVRLSPERADAIKNLFAVILWGELAAWQVSADLALRLEPLGARLAATSQAHDEARHFYVMRDYLELLGEPPRSLQPRTLATLSDVAGADSLLKKVLGMQLMVEPMALTLFQLVREQQVEPVLCDLLVLYERDEARHVALGVLHLPDMLAGLSRRATLDLWAWQMRAYLGQLAMLRELAPDFRALGVDPRAAFRLGREKQLVAARLLTDEMGVGLPALELFRRVTDFRAELDFPEDGGPGGDLAALRSAVRVALRAMEDLSDAPLSPVAEV